MAELSLPRVLFFVEGYTDIRFVVGLSEVCDLTMAVPARAYEESGLKARVAASGARLQVHEIAGGRASFQLRSFAYLWNAVRDFDLVFSQEMLRGSLIEVAGVRQAAEGRETKAAVVYQYLTGARFKQHMQAIVEAFTTMQEDSGAEKKVMMKQWAKREMQIERVIGSTAGFTGICRGLLGRVWAR